jgi:hypothetical protein
MFGIRTRRENREQFRLLEMEIELLLDRIKQLEDGDRLPSFPHGNIITMSNELFNYTELREKYRPHKKIFDL